MHAAHTQHLGLVPPRFRAQELTRSSAQEKETGNGRLNKFTKSGRGDYVSDQEEIGPKSVTIELEPRQTGEIVFTFRRRQKKLVLDLLL